MDTVINCPESRDLLGGSQQQGRFGKQNLRLCLWIALVFGLATIPILGWLTVTSLAAATSPNETSLTYRTNSSTDTTEPTGQFVTEFSDVTIAAFVAESFINATSISTEALNNTVTGTVVATNDTVIAAKEGYEQTVNDATLLESIDGQNPPARKVGDVLVKDGPIHNCSESDAATMLTKSPPGNQAGKIVKLSDAATDNSFFYKPR